MRTALVIRQAQGEAFIAAGSRTIITKAQAPCVRIVSSNGAAVILAGSRGQQGERGIEGPPGPAGGAPYVWTQSIALSAWTIPHNLARFPSVTVVDNLGIRVEPDVTYIDQNTVQIFHGLPFAGLAFLN